MTPRGTRSRKGTRRLSSDLDSRLPMACARTIGITTSSSDRARQMRRTRAQPQSTPPYGSRNAVDVVLVFGPIGDFVLHETRTAVLLAGGIGVTTHKGMAEYASDKALPIPMRLVYSNRSQDEIVYRDELDSLE